MPRTPGKSPAGLRSIMACATITRLICRNSTGALPSSPPLRLNPAVGNLLGAAIYDGSGPGRCNCNIAHNYPLCLRPAAGRGLSDQLQDGVPRRLRHRLRRHGGQQQRRGRLGAPPATQPHAEFRLSSYHSGRRAIPPPIIRRLAEFRSRAVPDVRAQSGAWSGALWIRTRARPARQYQWSIGFQREIFKNLVVEASYVANRGVWWQAPALLNLNAITPLDSGRASDSTSITPPTGRC